MDAATWKLWGAGFLNYSKALGGKIADGAIYVGQKTKEGAIYVGQKTKEGALYVAEKSKPATDKIKEGALYVAEKTKPATDKIKEGASFVGTKIKETYVETKSKITGEQPPQPQQQPEGNPQDQNLVQQENGEVPTTTATTETLDNQQPPSEVPTTMASTETLDNQQNQNQDNPYPQI